MDAPRRQQWPFQQGGYCRGFGMIHEGGGRYADARRRLLMTPTGTSTVVSMNASSAH